jgi:hypothetical protein
LINNGSKQSVLKWEIAVQLVDSIKKPINSIKEAERIIKNSSKYSKINLSRGAWQKRFDSRSGLINVELLSNRRSLVPFSWFDYEGIVESRPSP